MTELVSLPADLTNLGLVSGLFRCSRNFKGKMCVFYILSLNMNIQQDLRSELENKQPYHCSAIQPASAVIGEWRYYIRNILSYYPEPGQCGRRFIFYNFISADINKERLNTQLLLFCSCFCSRACQAASRMWRRILGSQGNALSSVQSTHVSLCLSVSLSLCLALWSLLSWSG